MSGINKVIIVGNLGQDPEMRYMQDGTACANFTVATSDTWNDKQTGEKKEKTEWHRVVAWRKLAEFIGEYIGKGRQVYVEGKLQTRKWEKDGVTHYTTEIVANIIQALGPRTGNATNTTPNSGSNADHNNMPDQGYPDGRPPQHQEDDIPF